jgi:hypothetical protein
MRLEQQTAASFAAARLGQPVRTTLRAQLLSILLLMGP